MTEGGKMLVESVVIEIKNIVLKELSEEWKIIKPVIRPEDYETEYDIVFFYNYLPVILEVADCLMYTFVAANDEGKQRLADFLAKELIDRKDQKEQESYKYACRPENYDDDDDDDDDDENENFWS